MSSQLTILSREPAREPARESANPPNQVQVPTEFALFPYFPSDLRLKIWRDAFDYLQQDCYSIRKEGQVYSVQIRRRHRPLAFNACHEARKEMHHLLFHNLVEIGQRQDATLNDRRLFETICFSSRLFAPKDTMHFLTSLSIAEDSLFCFPATAELSSMIIDRPMKRHRNKTLMKMLLREVADILEELKFYSSLKRIEVICDYPALVGEKHEQPYLTWHHLELANRDTHHPLRFRFLAKAMRRQRRKVSVVYEERHTQYFLSALTNLVEVAKQKDPQLEIPSIVFI